MLINRKNVWMEENKKLHRSWIVDNGRNETENDLCGFKFSTRKKAKLERMGNTIKQVVFDKLSIPSLIYTNWTLNVCTYLSMNEITINASARVKLRTKLLTDLW